MAGCGKGRELELETCMEVYWGVVCGVWVGAILTEWVYELLDIGTLVLGEPCFGSRLMSLKPPMAVIAIWCRPRRISN